ncbi:uncharacterized protein LOC143291846 [Babylonia areolata]|uniref:uncharacterized protein LOC143291846 n=1 Tax=Babylonia areolata TaxID=304850 RepID=UPI003FD6AD31
MHTARVRGLLLLFFLGVLHCTCSQPGSQPRSRRRQRQNSRGSANPDIAILLTSMDASGSLEDWTHPFHSITPTTPEPENINCHVEIVPPTRVGGVCKRLGRPVRRRGRNNRRRNQAMWACQAGVHLQMGHPDCGRNQNRRSQHRNG